MTHTFRRLDGLPPYVFATIRDLTLELRRAGEDVVDLGFGNPDLPSPEVAVAKLQEAAAKPHNHRYSASKGIPKLRAACADLPLGDVQLEHREIGAPDQGGQILDDDVGDLVVAAGASRRRQGHPSDPVRGV